MNSELARRIAFTLGALLVYRIGTHIPLPGINPAVWDHLFGSQPDGLLGMVNAASGGAIARLAVFALGITPYITAAISVQVMSLLVPRLRGLRAAGERGRSTIDRYTWFLALFLAAFQSYGMALVLEGVTGLVIEPGWPFRMAAVFTLTGGTMFLTWLAGQMTSRGIGNGIALILCAGILVELPRSIFGAAELGRQGLLPEHLLAGTALLALALVIAVVAVEKARRLEPVAFSEPGRAPAHLSFKLNGAGLIPALIASWVLALPLALIGLFAPDAAGFGRAAFSPGAPLYLVCYALVIFFAVYLYTAFVLDPAEAAGTLQRYGGAIPLVAPGNATADHLDGVLSRITLIGAAYFVTVCLIPDLLISWAQVPFYLSGTSLLVLVCTVLDLEAEVRGLGQMELGG